MNLSMGASTIGDELISFLTEVNRDRVKALEKIQSLPNEKIAEWMVSFQSMQFDGIDRILDGEFYAYMNTRNPKLKKSFGMVVFSLQCVVFNWTREGEISGFKVTELIQGGNFGNVAWGLFSFKSLWEWKDIVLDKAGFLQIAQFYLAALTFWIDLLKEAKVPKQKIENIIDATNKFNPLVNIWLNQIRYMNYRHIKEGLIF